MGNILHIKSSKLGELVGLMTPRFISRLIPSTEDNGQQQKLSTFREETKKDTLVKWIMYTFSIDFYVCTQEGYEVTVSDIGSTQLY